jgi:uncharacterized protein
MKKEFTWNPAKAASNKLRHGISFADAASVFLDLGRLTEIDDAGHGEYRWTTIGKTDEGNVVLLVIHSDWEEDEIEIIRIISARMATPAERKRYEQNRHSLHLTVRIRRSGQPNKNGSLSVCTIVLILKSTLATFQN